MLNRSGFTIVDAAVGMAAIGVLGALAAAGLGESRRSAQHALCSAKLAAIGASNGQFALSSNGLMVGLTWEQGGANSQYPDLNALQSTPGAGPHAAQAIDILRRRGRPDVPSISAWAADLNYWSLALVDFEDRPLSDAFNLCPSHDNLNKWRRWPQLFDQGAFGNRQPTPSATNKRWPYSSSYTLTGAAFDKNQTVFTPAAVASRIANNTSHNIYTIPGTASLGPSPMSMVSNPSLKVHVFDSHQRHLPGPHLYFGYASATQPMLFFDGSVRVKTSSAAVTPWNPNSPSLQLPLGYTYQPMAWEPPTQSGQQGEFVQDRYRWTRNGLQGTDFLD